MNCPSESCKHNTLIEERKRVTPPKHVNFEIRFNRCPECGDIVATPEQRKKNHKQANYAYNSYKNRNMALWGIQ